MKVKTWFLITYIFMHSKNNWHFYIIFIIQICLCLNGVGNMSYIVFSSNADCVTRCTKQTFCWTRWIKANDGIIEIIKPTFDLWVFSTRKNTGKSKYFDHNGRLIFIQSFNILEITSLGVEHKKTAMNCWIQYLVEYLMKSITLM